MSFEVPPICCNFSSCVHEDCWYIFSGQQSGAKGSNHLYQFHFPTAKWRRISTEHILRSQPHILQSANSK